MVSNQLFVGGIPNDVTQDEIVKLFSGYGKLKKLVMPMEKGRNRGFAFVTYEGCDSVNAVFDDLKNVRIRAKEVDLKAGRQGNEQRKTGQIGRRTVLRGNQERPKQLRFLLPQEQRGHCFAGRVRSGKHAVFETF